MLFLKFSTITTAMGSSWLLFSGKTVGYKQDPLCEDKRVKSAIHTNCQQCLVLTAMHNGTQLVSFCSSMESVHTPSTNHRTIYVISAIMLQCKNCRKVDT